MKGVHLSHGRVKSMTSVALLVLVTGVASTAFPLTKMQQPEPTPPPPAAAKTSPKLLGTPWKLVALNGKPLDPKPPMVPEFTMIQDGSRIVGYSGCNRFMGTFSLSEDKLTVNGDMAMTRKACVKQANLESDFVKAIQSVDSWKITDGTLEFYRQKVVVASFQTNPPQ
jgi:heat shock protein HslJ